MVKGRKGGLGKGLDSLIPEVIEQPAETGKDPMVLPLAQIEPNRAQPRKTFEEEELKELAESVKTYGVLQPLLVRKKGDRFEIIAGERRWRAAKMAGLREVPVIVKDYTAREVMEISLIENIQRADLSPLEEARAYEALIDEYKLTQEELAGRLSKSRSVITNSLRLLKLDEEVRRLLEDGELSAGHARALAGLEDKELQRAAARRIAADGLSVRGAEQLVKEMREPAGEKKPRREKEPESESVKLAYRQAEEKLCSGLGTQVRIRRQGEGGRIEISYYSLEELERLIERLG